MITKELILKLLSEQVNGKRFYPTDYQGKRKVYCRNAMSLQDKNYRLIFWFKDNTTDHLWIRNCHLQD